MAQSSEPGRITVIMPAERQGERLDRALADLLPGESRTALQRLFRAGRVRLPDGPARTSYRVHGGEVVVLDRPEPPASTLDAEPSPLAVIHEDSDLLVLNKPPGVAVHPGSGRRRGTLVNFLLGRGTDLSGAGGAERPGIVHRLDRDTSGALVVAKNDPSHRALAAQFKARTVRKEYEALVWGVPRAAHGTIDAPIGRDQRARVRMAIRAGGREARTHWRTAERLGPVTLLAVHPETGRTHQIRVHLRSIGHPIVGDRLYGGAGSPVLRDHAFREALAGWSGLALHARRLGFRHPRSGDWIECEAPRPGELEALLRRLRAASRPGISTGDRP